MKISRDVVPRGLPGLVAGTLSGVGFAALLFGGVFAVLVAATAVQLRTADPLESEAVDAAIRRLMEDPDTQEIREEVRALDYLSRKAYLIGSTQVRSGVRIVVFSALIAVACFGIAGLLRGVIPVIETSRTREKDAANATAIGDEYTEYRADRTARTVFWIGGGILYAAALIASYTLVDDGIGTGGTTVTTTGTATESEFPSAAELAENWPVFRGARASTGREADQTSDQDILPPIEWNADTGRNLLWSAKVPKPGYGSPVVWEDSLFLSGGDEEGFSVTCYASSSGEIRWERDVAASTGSDYPLPDVSEDTGYAAASPAVDGRHVYAIFATGELVAFDFDGNLVWSRFMGTPVNIYGHSSSLAIYRGLVFVQYDHDGEASVTALDGATGEVVWSKSRDVYTSWASPLVIDDGENSALVLNANPFVTAYDPITGEELWSVDCMGGEVAPSPAYEDGIVYAANQYAVLAAIDLGSGELLWEGWDDLPEVSSPLAHAGYIVLAAGYGGVTCYSAETEEPVWHVEYENGIYSSPVSIGGWVYLTDNSGKTHIFEPAPEYAEIGTGSVGEPVLSTPAYSGGRLFIRGTEHLYCIGVVE